MVVDAAGSQHGISPVVCIPIFGSNPAYTTCRAGKDSEILGGKLPTPLDGVSVTIDNRLAAVSYISPLQLNVQVPDDTATGPVPVAVTTPQGTATTTTTMQTGWPGPSMYQAANANIGGCAARGMIPSWGHPACIREHPARRNRVR